MTTPAFEAFLAKLYTDLDFLRRFYADPQGEAQRAGLSPLECAALAEVDKAGLNAAASSFRKKREGKHM